MPKLFRASPNSFVKTLIYAFLNENDCYIKCQALSHATRDYLGKEDNFLHMRDFYEAYYFNENVLKCGDWEISKPQMLELIMTQKIKNFGKHWKSFFEFMDIG
jgi:hypothetical protein